MKQGIYQREDQPSASIATCQDQMKDYSAERTRERELADSYVAELHEYWAELAGGKPRQYPGATFLHRYLTVFSVEDIRSAMEIAVDQAGDWRGCVYLTDILRNWREAGEISL